VAAAVGDLVAAGVESLAVCLLWSPANPGHEDRVAEIARAQAPGLRVAVSHRIAPRIGEYERMSTAVIDAYVAPLVGSYLERLEAQLRRTGFRGAFVVMRMGGGVQPAEVARRHPIHTLRSGPAGGVAASRRLAARAGHRNVIATDVGGTSFDVGLIIDGEPQYARQPTIDRRPIATRAVDISSIGTGGGSIAWIDETLGALRVGPQSASSRPGPACYGLGGDRATLTDAAVVLGYVDRLGDALVLQREAAWRAIETTVAAPLGLDVLAAAEGIVQVSCAQMRDLIRRCTTQRGRDPAEFALIAYGGAGPQFAGRFAADLGVSASWCRCWRRPVRVRRTVQRPAGAVGPRPAADPAGRGARVGEPDVRGAGAEVRAQLAGAGHEDEVRISCSVALRYYRQIHRMDLEVAAPLDAAAVARVIDTFRERYEAVVGAGSAPPDTPVEVVAVGVEAVLPTHVADPPARSAKPAEPARRKPAVFGGAEVDCPVYDWESLGAGQVVTGPAFVETRTTTAVIYPAQHATVAESGDLILALES